MTFNPAADANSGFQYVPVPNEHVPAVLAFLADRLAPSAVRSPGKAQPAPDADPADEWSDKDLLKFVSMPTKTSAVVRAMLDYLSERPGQDSALSTDGLAKALGIDYFVMKNLPTQISRTLGKHFPGKDSPCVHRWGPEFTTAQPAELYFYVTPERAAQWKRLQA